LRRCHISMVGLVTMLALAGCAAAPPRIGAGLHGSVEEVQAEFDRRVRAQFPIGSAETVLRAELVREKFRIRRDKDSPFSFSANYASNYIACRLDWTIRWSVYAGTIADIAGHWQQTCL
jgi:hypothetical protein